MSLEDSLRKVEYDLSTGNYIKAYQRLTGLLSPFAYSCNLQIRRMLGDLYWQLGNKIEAGRFWYLEEHKTPEMTDACHRFEKAYSRSASRIGWRLKLHCDIAEIRQQSRYALQIISDLQERSWNEFIEKYPLTFWDSSRQPDPPPDTNHVLVVDSTGLLRDLPFNLTRRFNQDKIVSVLLSNEQYAQFLDSKFHTHKLRPIVIDFNDQNSLRIALKDATERLGLFERAVVWIPSEAISMHQTIAESVRGSYFHVLDCNVGNPESTVKTPYSMLTAYKNVGYCQIVLGWKNEHGHSRWLTRDEVTRGIIDAVGGGRTRTMIGRIRSWKNRPPGEPTYIGEVA